MSAAIATPVPAPLLARLRRLGAPFLFLWVVFYLADPLDYKFSTSELVNLEESDLTTMDRVEQNIETQQAGNVRRQVALIALACYGIFLLATRSDQAVEVRGWLGVVSVFFLAWCAATVAWSGLPEVTARKLVVLACLCLGALGVARHFTAGEVLSFTLFGCGLVLAAGLVSECVLGTFRPWRASYRFSGLTWPAFSAWNASLFLLALMTRLRTTVRHRTGLILAALGGFVLLLLTKTRASVAAFVVAAMLHAWLIWPRHRTLAVALGLCLAGSLGGLLVEVSGSRWLDGLVDAVNLGRTESASGISGRAELWAALAPFIRERPLGGYGYETFWTPNRLLEVGQENWGAPDAHNGFINLTLGAGMVGTGAYATVLLLGLWRSSVSYRKTAEVSHVFAGCAILVLVINALFVSTQLAPALYSFVTLVLLARAGFVEGVRSPSTTGNATEVRT